ncbi:type VII secretion target [Phytomonospora sp. NPDC050363]|uniref:type VII secretion target n=1 Tax=Phytomonospora sp. NPDC050363 TaxID=3155642 RepID=UPI00340EA5E0
MRIDPQKVRQLARRVRDAADDIESAARGRSPQVESAHSGMNGYSAAAELQRISSQLGTQLRGLHPRTTALAGAMETAAANHTANDQAERERFLRHLNTLKD